MVPEIEVNGVHMYYREQGEGEALVLLHGLGTGSADWEFQIPALAQHYRVIAPCLRGFGESGRPAGPYSIPTFADDVAVLLDALNLARCHLCGVSMGGAVAFQFAVDRPGRLDSLIAINSQPSFALTSPKKRLLFLSRLWMARTLGLERLARIQAKRNFPGAAHAPLRRRLQGRYRNHPDTYLETLRSLGGWEVLDRLDNIELPVLMIAAAHDYTAPEEKHRYAALMPDARVEIIEGAHHAVHLERPDAVNRALLGFLADVEARRGPVPPAA